MALLATRMVGDVHVYEVFGESPKPVEDEKPGAGEVKTVVQTMVWAWTSDETLMTCRYLLWSSVTLLISTCPWGWQPITGAHLPLYLTSQSTVTESISFTEWCGELMFVLHCGSVAAATITTYLHVRDNISETIFTIHLNSLLSSFICRKNMNAQNISKTMNRGQGTPGCANPHRPSKRNACMHTFIRTKNHTGHLQCYAS